MPAPPMRYHLLAPEVKCPACGAGLTFIRSRTNGDLYRCASGGLCKCYVIHYRKPLTKICGYSILHSYGVFGKWTACGETAHPRPSYRPLLAHVQIYRYTGIQVFRYTDIVSI
jgi:hypothetical protein